jgi:hypothetical protein
MWEENQVAWTCDECTKPNDDGRDRCDNCGANKPDHIKY